MNPEVTQARFDGHLGIGVMGGTFDPVHFGHLRTALEMLEGLGLSEVRMLPCGEPPHREQPVAEPEQRWAMLRLALADQSGLVADRRELERSGPSYMVDTLESLRRELGDAQPLCLILGEDAFAALPRWHQWQRIMELAHVVVCHRPGDETQYPEALLGTIAERRAAMRSALTRRPAGLIFFHSVTQLAISATDIRGRIAQQLDPRYLLPDAVWDFIRQNRLYIDSGP